MKRNKISLWSGLHEAWSMHGSLFLSLLSLQSDNMAFVETSLAASACDTGRSLGPLEEFWLVSVGSLTTHLPTLSAPPSRNTNWERGTYLCSEERRETDVGPSMHEATGVIRCQQPQWLMFGQWMVFQSRGFNWRKYCIQSRLGGFYWTIIFLNRLSQSPVGLRLPGWSLTLAWSCFHLLSVGLIWTANWADTTCKKETFWYTVTPWKVKKRKSSFLANCPLSFKTNKQTNTGDEVKKRRRTVVPIHASCQHRIKLFNFRIVRCGGGAL